MMFGVGMLGQVGGASAAFSPASAFTAGKKGLWWDPSDIALSYQDSGGTTPLSATGQPVGKGNDKSGNANHFLQATAPSRPFYTVAGALSSWLHDGVDDGGSTATVGAGTFSSAMDCFITLKKNSASSMAVASGVPGDSTRILGGLVSASGNGAVRAVGSAWTAWVNGVQVGGTATATEGQMFTAVGSGAYKVIAFYDLDMSLWTQITLGLYPSFMLNGDVAQFILCESQSALRSSLLTYSGAKGGLVL